MSFRYLDLAANLSQEEAMEYPVEEDLRGALRRDDFLRRNKQKIFEIAREFIGKKMPQEILRMIIKAKEIGLMNDIMPDLWDSIQNQLYSEKV